MPTQRVKQASPAYIFSGSRGWLDQYIVKVVMGGLWYMQRSLPQEKILIVEGEEKRGLDAIAKSTAEAMKLPHRGMAADWDKYGRGAGPVRNRQMLEENDVKAVFCFSDDIAQTAGTADMMLAATHAGVLTYHIRKVNDEETDV